MDVTIKPVDEDATCAVCDEPVRAVLGTPSRQVVSPSVTAYAARAWCTLEPCGHTYSVRRGGLIY
jgi:CO dehydrogenase/acetyl-CoA synthase beta subunit